MKYSDTKT